SIAPLRMAVIRAENSAPLPSNSVTSSPTVARMTALRWRASSPVTTARSPRIGGLTKNRSDIVRWKIRRKPFKSSCDSTDASKDTHPSAQRETAMYDAYWGLQRPLFTPAAVRQSLASSPVHAEALARLDFLCESRSPFGL